MKILIISHEYPPVGGGGANACLNLSHEYVKAGHCVIVISAWFEGLPEREDDNGVQIIRVKSRRKSKAYSSFFEMADYLCKAWPVAEQLEKEKQFDVCQVFFGIPSGPIGYLLKRKYKVPYIIRFGGGDVPGFQDRFKFVYKFIGPMLKVIWDNAEALIANSNELKRMALDFYSKKEILVIYNGVDTEIFHPILCDDRDNNRVNILFVSRLIERKGLQFIIPTLKYIQKKVKKRIHLTIVGEGPYRKELEELAISNNCKNMVSFEGQKDKCEIISYYQNADIFILPSKREGMPNVVLEAMACGLPVIMTPCGGSSELITDNGIISPTENFADNVIKICIDKKKRETMGKNSLENIEINFKWGKIAGKYLDVLENIKGK